MWISQPHLLKSLSFPHWTRQKGKRVRESKFDTCLWLFFYDHQRRVGIEYWMRSTGLQLAVDDPPGSLCARVCKVASVVSVCQTPLSMRFSRQELLEWVTVPSFRGSSWPRDQNCISYISCVGRGWISVVSRFPGVIFLLLFTYLSLLFLQYLPPLQSAEIKNRITREGNPQSGS